jgi:hypothetical protein
LYYYGTGFTENDNNPGNDNPGNYPPVTATYPSSTDVCTALLNCSNFADAAYYYDLIFQCKLSLVRSWWRNVVL